MAAASQAPGTNSWSVVAIVFIALFVLLLFGSSLVISYLYHKKKQQKELNPYLYGSENWLAYERMMAPQAERDALAIASLECRLSVQEQYSHEADRMIELLDRSQKHLTFQLRDEHRKSQPIDPEAFQRVYDDIHKSLERPRPSLPTLIAKLSPKSRFASPVLPVVKSPSSTQTTSPVPSAAKYSPTITPFKLPSPYATQHAPVLLQSTKLREIMRNSMRRGAARSTRFVEHHVKPSSVVMVDPADEEFEDVDLSLDDYEPAPFVGKKPFNFHAK